MKKVILIIPAYNEEKNILEVINAVKNYSSKTISLDYIIINDGSVDNTKEICAKNSLNVINLINNLGIGGAVQTGYKYAYDNGYDIAIQFDGDGQHDINYIDNLCVDIINNKSDLVIGSRFKEKEKEGFKSTRMRRVGKNIISFFIKLLTKKIITDPTSGFRAGNRKVIKEFASYYPYDYPEPESIVYLIKKGYNIKEVSVIMKVRKEGKSSINIFKSIEYMLKVCIAIMIESSIIYKRGKENDINRT